MFSYNIVLKIVLGLGVSILAFAPHAYAADDVNVYKEREDLAKRKREQRKADQEEREADQEEHILARGEQRSVPSGSDISSSIGLDIGRFGSNEHGTVLIGQVGFGVNDIWSVELRGGFSTKGLSTASDAKRLLARELDEVKDNPDAYLDIFWGMYVRSNFMWLFSPDRHRSPFEPYLMLGYTWATVSAVDHDAVDASGPIIVLDAAEPSTVSYGLGATWTLDNGLSFDIEYMRYLDKSGFSIGGITLGVNRTWEWSTR